MNTATSQKIQASLPEQDKPWVGRILANKYCLEALIAEGGMGQIYRARHIALDVPRAVKLIKTGFLSNQQARQRFEREIHTTHKVSQLNKHIVLIYDDYGYIDGYGYFVMELLEGELLSQRIRQHGSSLPIPWIIETTLQICAGMEAVHQKGIIHRDLKPDNIFLVQHNQQADFVKLLDFGIAKHSQHNGFSTHSDHFVGTLPYMSPEQIIGRSTLTDTEKPAQLDARTDIYALGCTLFEMLVGHPPFPLQGIPSPLASTRVIQAHLHQTPPALPTLRPEIPPGLTYVVERMLAKQPDDRFQTMADVATALQSLDLDAPAPQITTPRPAETLASHPQTSRVFWRNLFLGSLAFLVILSVSVLSWWSVRQNQRLPRQARPHVLRPTKRSQTPQMQKALAVASRGPFTRPIQQKPGQQPIQPGPAPTQESDAKSKTSDQTDTVPSRQRSSSARGRKSTTPKRTTRRLRRRSRRRRDVAERRRMRKKSKPAQARTKPVTEWIVTIIPANYLQTHNLEVPLSIDVSPQELRVPMHLRTFRVRVVHKTQKTRYEPCSFTLAYPTKKLRLRQLIREGLQLPEKEDYCVISTSQK